MNYPTAERTVFYDGKTLTALFWIKTDRHGNVDHENSRAQLSLKDISLRLPLLWSTSVTVKQAHAAIQIFEATGVTLAIN